MSEDTSENAPVKPPCYTFSEYKGHKLLVLGGETKYPFSFGAGKAKFLLEAMEELGLEGFKKLLQDLVAQGKSEK